jgi:hypothetical protein
METIRSLSKSKLLGLTNDLDEEVPVVIGYRHTNHREIVEEGERPQREPVFKTWDRDHWEHIQSTYNASERIWNQFGDENIEVGVTSESRSRVDLGVKVTVRTIERYDGSIDAPDLSVDTLRNEIPNQVERTLNGEVVGDPIDIELDTRVVRETSDSASSSPYFKKAYRPIPGGCEADTSYTSPGGNWTVGPPVYDNDLGKSVLTTASHCVYRSSGQSIYQSSGSYSNEIGSSDKVLSDGNGDAATIDVDSNNIIKYDLAEYLDESGDYLGRTVNGVMGEEGIKDMVAFGSYATHQGMKTGRNKGAIVEHRNRSSLGDAVLIDVNSSEGDSGAPIFDRRNVDEAMMIGIGAWEATDPTQAGGNCMYYIENALNVTV